MAAIALNRIFSFGSRKHSAVLNAITKYSVRSFSFTFAGPRSLEEIIKKELVEDKTRSELEDIWKTYHEQKVSRKWSVRMACLLLFLWRYDTWMQQDTIALVLDGEDGKNVTSRSNQ